MNTDVYKIAVCDDSRADSEYIAALVKEWAENRAVKIQTFPSAEAFMFYYADEKDFDILLLDMSIIKRDPKEMTSVEKYFERKKLEDGNKWFFQVLEDNTPVTLLENNIDDYKLWMNSLWRS